MKHLKYLGIGALLMILGSIVLVGLYFIVEFLLTHRIVIAVIIGILGSYWVGREYYKEFIEYNKQKTKPIKN